MNHFGFPAALLVAICFAGCSRHEPPPVQHPASTKPAAVPAPAPVPAALAAEAQEVDKTRKAEMMQAIFGDDYHAEDDDMALAEIKDGENAGYWRMTMIAAKALPDGRTAVVVNGAPANENGVDTSAHASAGMLNVYTLRRTGGHGKWSSAIRTSARWAPMAISGS